ncbi:Rpp14/Pop5 family protein [Nitzschia inconspicua]|uniref:Rpp14/Pop5 family protein n=1 Tax=Nitzschia inconspicua TaxID=303405 RepID=A0A9K3K4A0_9STRA|nr:Rpp14/Pop5 family protein [Nitzschia inconspicua]KAG7350087.1 Rpp14/Pop5 family protein [Nitzschia inconspicua]
MERLQSTTVDSSRVDPLLTLPSKQQQQQSCIILGVTCSPKLHDPSEVMTILTTSLKALFGELESYSFGMKVYKNKHNDDDDFVIECPQQSADAIRAALTMPTLPPFLEEGGVYYCFDTHSPITFQ